MKSYFFFLQRFKNNNWKITVIHNRQGKEKPYDQNNCAEYEFDKIRHPFLIKKKKNQ